ncbi:MAG: PadR family transcriptional regulator [Gemmatimonadaceae bacterium]|nr:PadR family transcriptional regulator [Gemmatimonadaceae bacterium]
MPDSREVVQGTLDLLVLSSLRAGSMHGWGIAQRIRERSGDAVLVTTGALYPALHRLEERRLVRSRWLTSEANRRARFYDLTAAGRKALGEEVEWWTRFTAGVAGVIATS